MSEFLYKHLGHSPEEIKQILKTLKLPSLETMYANLAPKGLIVDMPNVETPMSEGEFLEHIDELANKNQKMRYLIGKGCYSTRMPSVIAKAVMQNPGWYTAYTPYQAEISQGRLEVLFNFQTMIADLNGLDVANASLLDEASACCEAVLMASRINKDSNCIFVDENLHPQNINAIKTRAIFLGLKLVVDDLVNLHKYDFFAAITQYVGTNGDVASLDDFSEKVHMKGAIAICVSEPLSLMILKSPGECGIDIAVGSSQRFGLPMGFGGPAAGFICCKQGFIKNLPGRLVGLSKDKNGKPAYRLALQTREQHIRREKANSNICTAQSLTAIISVFYAMYIGRQGLLELAKTIAHTGLVFSHYLEKHSIKPLNKRGFDTYSFQLAKAKDIYERLLAQGIHLYFDGADIISITFDEKISLSELQAIIRAFTGEEASITDLKATPVNVEKLVSRQDLPLSYPEFTEHFSETKMMRYMRNLMDKDYALDRGMIPLGSCTMKLNSATSMMPMTDPRWGDVHPLAEPRFVNGYMSVIGGITSQLKRLTGFDEIFLQPNAGSQGEYAALITIRNYFMSKGEVRDICLLPSSAHGTNPSSATLAGMSVMGVAQNADGSVDLSSLEAILQEHGKKVAVAMITYPGTNTCFDQNIQKISDMLHKVGAKLYIDGANFNSLGGLIQPAKFGDVMHLNLHKTFAIPHGGGGPGIGPIGVSAELAPFLPSYLLGSRNDYCVSSFPYGSANALLISYAYNCMMGEHGHRQATLVAILNANYIAQKLEKIGYKILYKNSHSLVPHECIVDFKEWKGLVSVEDVAKRLMDYGFHAPTVAFPIHDTMMIEPTESEDLGELDRFCDAMRHIFNEISDVKSGKYPKDNNPLVNAPHIEEDLLVEKWEKPYSRQLATNPISASRNKYWTPVSRVDALFGDKNPLLRK